MPLAAILPVGHSNLDMNNDKNQQAESLLGVTNIVLAMGAFQALEAAKRDGPREGRRWTD